MSILQAQTNTHIYTIIMYELSHVHIHVHLITHEPDQCTSMHTQAHMYILLPLAHTSVHTIIHEHKHTQNTSTYNPSHVQAHRFHMYFTDEQNSEEV